MLHLDKAIVPIHRTEQGKFVHAGKVNKTDRMKKDFQNSCYNSISI